MCTKHTSAIGGHISDSFVIGSWVCFVLSCSSAHHLLSHFLKSFVCKRHTQHVRMTANKGYSKHIQNLPKFRVFLEFNSFAEHLENKMFFFFFSFPLQICFCWKLAVRVAKREGERKRERLHWNQSAKSASLMLHCKPGPAEDLKSFIHSVSDTGKQQTKGVFVWCADFWQNDSRQCIIRFSHSLRPSVRPSIRRWKLRHKLPWEFHCFWTTER